MEYGYRKIVYLAFPEALERIKSELAKEGFGILTEINVRETLKKKIGVDFVDYVILGACNPPFAFEALKAEKEIGLMLPCNVIVYEDDGQVYVSAIMPTVAMEMAENDSLKRIALEVEKKLKSAVDKAGS